VKDYYFQLLAAYIFTLMENYKEQETSDRKIIVLCLILSVAIFIIDTLIPLGVAGGVPYILVVLISLWSSRINLPLYMAIGGSVLTVIGYYSSPPGGELWQVLFNRTLALFAIWTTAILSALWKNIQKEKEKALLDLKILSGLIPICASCKKIRDDGGYWEQIETYIRDHSEADFSHGICPECAKELYGDFYKEKAIESDT
jgi:hypothetical protein